MGYEVVVTRPSIGDGRIVGTFREKEHGRYFDFSDVVDEWGEQVGATHTVFVGGPGDGARAAQVLKTVAYIAVDEAEGGGAVWEKWQIRMVESYV